MEKDEEQPRRRGRSLRTELSAPVIGAIYPAVKVSPALAHAARDLLPQRVQKGGFLSSAEFQAAEIILLVRKALMRVFTSFETPDL